MSRTRRAVIVTLPLQCDLDEAGSFLDRNMAWVQERLAHLPRPVSFTDGAYLPLRGVTHRIRFMGTGVRGVATSRREGAEFAELRTGGAPEHAGRRLMDWLMAEARRDLDSAVTKHTSALGVRAKKITVRDQSSRWGSCSSNGALSFSWRLILAPPAILDYVAAHEVAHLVEMNHGSRFWALTRRLYPELDQAKRWLQIYGMDLHRYGNREPN